MHRQTKIALVLLVAGVIAGAIYLRRLDRELLRLASPAATDVQSHLAVTRPPVSTPSDVKSKARIFWSSPQRPGTLEAVEVELSLSADPAQRARQVLGTLLNSAPQQEQRTLPADAVLLAFYLLADGTAVADFSDHVARGTPSGISSERLAVESILRTLEANVPAVQHVKILIHGQEAETLAGHFDLTGTFQLRGGEAAAAQATAATAGTAKSAAAGLTPPREPAKLNP